MTNYEQYDEKFYSDIDTGSHNSALVVTKLMLEIFGKIDSVIDFGCGRGVWLAEFRKAGVNTVFGLDFGVGATSRLAIAQEQYRSANLGAPVQVIPHDLCISLEVAEHIALNHAENFIDNLTQSARKILFSAAVPDQMGHHHINEQAPQFWIEKFAKRGFVCIDVIRPTIWNDSRICWWYRQNVMLFIHEAEKELIAGLSQKKSFHGAWLIHPDSFSARHKWLMDVISAGTDHPPVTSREDYNNSAEAIIYRLRKSVFWKATRPLHGLSSATRKIEKYGR